MGRAIRKLAVFAAMLALVAGTWLPGDGPNFDADGICGTVLAQGPATARVAANNGQAGQSSHCLFCHWRHTMASASAVAFVAIAVPVDAGRAPVGRLSTHLTTTEVGAAAPRGPPAVS